MRLVRPIVAQNFATDSAQRATALAKFKIGVRYGISRGLRCPNAGQDDSTGAWAFDSWKQRPAPKTYPNASGRPGGYDAGAAPSPRRASFLAPLQALTGWFFFQAAYSWGMQTAHGR